MGALVVIEGHESALCDRERAIDHYKRMLPASVDRRAAVLSSSVKFVVAGTFASARLPVRRSVGPFEPGLARNHFGVTRVEPPRCLRLSGGSLCFRTIFDQARLLGTCLFESANGARLAGAALGRTERTAYLDLSVPPLVCRAKEEGKAAGLVALSFAMFAAERFVNAVLIGFR